MKRIAFILVGFFLTGSLAAQIDQSCGDPHFDTIIYTDRPDQTEAPQLTPRGWLQVETGTQREYDRNRIDSETTENTLFNTTLWKYGISKRFELRLITEFEEDKKWYVGPRYQNDSFETVSGMKPLKAGCKIFIQKQKGFIPAISFISHLTLPYFGEKSFRPKYILPDFRFTFAHELNKYLKVAYNLGAEWQNEITAFSPLYTAEVIISPTGRFCFYLESYGFLPENGSADHRADWGILYLLTNDMLLDCSGGIGLSEQSPDYFISLGLSFRINVTDRQRKH